jgi:hypothetical protein
MCLHCIVSAISNTRYEFDNRALAAKLKTFLLPNVKSEHKVNTSVPAVKFAPRAS